MLCKKVQNQKYSSVQKSEVIHAHPNGRISSGAARSELPRHPFKEGGNCKKAISPEHFDLGEGCS